MIISTLSGGETSAFMAMYLIDVFGVKNIKFIFANTGMEHKLTYEFIKKFRDYFNIDLTIVEAVIDKRKNKGTNYKIVDFDNMHIGKGIFEDMCEAYGIPNKAYPHCTRELKNKPVSKWRSVNGFKENDFAIGIRCDEVDRISKHTEKEKIIYPLISMRPTTKPEIRYFWSKMPFRLMVPEHKGNCVTCWKKSQRKLLTLAKKEPELFDDFAYLEENYKNHGSGDERQFLSGARFGVKKITIPDLIATAKLGGFHEFKENPIDYTPDLFGMDAPTGGCSERCEVFL